MSNFLKLNNKLINFDSIESIEVIYSKAELESIHEVFTKTISEPFLFIFRRKADAEEWTQHDGGPCCYAPQIFIRLSSDLIWYSYNMRSDGVLVEGGDIERFRFDDMDEAEEKAKELNNLLKKAAPFIGSMSGN